MSTTPSSRPGPDPMWDRIVNMLPTSRGTVTRLRRELALAGYYAAQRRAAFLRRRDRLAAAVRWRRATCSSRASTRGSRPRSARSAGYMAPGFLPPAPDQQRARRRFRTVWPTRWICFVLCLEAGIESRSGDRQGQRRARRRLSGARRSVAHPDQRDARRQAASRGVPRARGSDAGRRRARAGGDAGPDR